MMLDKFLNLSQSPFVQGEITKSLLNDWEDEEESPGKAKTYFHTPSSLLPCSSFSSCFHVYHVEFSALPYVILCNLHERALIQSEEVLLFYF